MSADDSNKPKKNDLTNLMDLPPADPPPVKDGSDPNQFNELPKIEQIDDFQSIDQIGMIDHPVPVETPAENLTETPIAAAPDAIAFEMPAFEMPAPEASTQTQPVQPSFTEVEAMPPLEQNTEASSPTEPMIAPSPEPFMDAPPTQITNTEFRPISPEPTPTAILENIREYSETSQETSMEYSRSFPFHLLIFGKFDPFARDKLLLFINANPLGISSSDLDFQINGGRVLIPRVSEYAGIRLIQELRETGLQFHLTPAPQDSDEVNPEVESLSVSWRHHSGVGSGPSEMAVLPIEAIDPLQHKIIDSIHLVQFIRAEVVDLESSELFQELLDRMLSGLKVRASRQGANALTGVKHTITPVGLPSQYQVELEASLVKTQS